MHHRDCDRRSRRVERQSLSACCRFLVWRARPVDYRSRCSLDFNVMLEPLAVLGGLGFAPACLQRRGNQQLTGPGSTQKCESDSEKFRAQRSYTRQNIGFSQRAERAIHARSLRATIARTYARGRDNDSCACVGPQSGPGYPPPSMQTFCPVMKPAWSEHRKATVAPNSCVVPKRPAGTAFLRSSSMTALATPRA